ncbi:MULTISPECIES: hypothetical protein [Paraburkholderia]|jgi:hypothetical protein|uniref:Adhesin n=1 Tax=Paraburkholderia largidicola TaxID=3014751 RepID=A0A7I8BGM8_9BURK|nr:MULTISPECIES: hypothetical protein [Paraburkholderia]BEU20708.1 adhesin [Paraburkholderia sp. 22B1P]GJH34785.1 hypothetical protein CBA19CS91_18530 [Paraburkholderia hospita]CAG9241381.1 conserved exported hypothetical protein [Paraburkholderia caribensis]BCF87792.1 hypothetical protein PPGU16_08590 [Paraburkholderia sp. PGU16]GJH01973.1 hypothetical protein CBA19C8_15470 [Paraburkholderia terrae]
MNTLLRPIPLLAALALLAAQPSYAQQAGRVSGDASIATGAAVSATGAITVNQAAGLNNAQTNQLTITNGEAVANDNASMQSATARARVPSARASIEGNAFSNSSGAVMVNQSAGAGNLQRNSVLLGTAAPGVETVPDGVLSATAANNGGQGRAVAPQGVRETSISSDAFKNVNGIVQINQTAGAGNATANSFVLRPPAGTLF